MTAVSERPSTGLTLGNHEERIRALEFSPGGGGACDDWIYVGTVGLDGVDSLITADSPPFQDGWTNSLGLDAPVSFMLDGCFVYIRGAAGGGAAGSVIFTLPVGYRPAYQQPLLVPAGDATEEAHVLVGLDGTVTYVGSDS